MSLEQIAPGHFNWRRISYVKTLLMARSMALCPLCDYPWSQGSDPEREDRGQKQLCFTYHGVRIKLDDGLCCWDGSKRYFIIVLRKVTTKIMSWDELGKVKIFLSYFLWQDLVFPLFLSTDFSILCKYPTCLVLNCTWCSLNNILYCVLPFPVGSPTCLLLIFYMEFSQSIPCNVPYWVISCL